MEESKKPGIDEIDAQTLKAQANDLNSRAKPARADAGKLAAKYRMLYGELYSRKEDIQICLLQFAEWVGGKNFGTFLRGKSFADAYV